MQTVNPQTYEDGYVSASNGGQREAKLGQDGRFFLAGHPAALYIYYLFAKEVDTRNYTWMYGTLARPTDKRQSQQAGLGMRSTETQITGSLATFPVQRRMQ